MNDKVMIVATVSRNIDGVWTSVRQIPTFYLPSDAGSLGSIAAVANAVIAPYGDMHVSMTLTRMSDLELLVIEF